MDIVKFSMANAMARNGRTFEALAELTIDMSCGPDELKKIVNILENMKIEIDKYIKFYAVSLNGE